jgi:hypothetical protein
MANARTQKTVLGRDELIWVIKPGATDPVLMGCMTEFTDNVPGADREEIACREENSVSPSGDKRLGTLPISGIGRRFPSAQAAAQVTGDEVRKWTKDVEILTIKWGGKYIGDPIYTCKGWFSDYSAANPNTGAKTWSVTFNKMEDEAESTVQAS